MTQLFCQSFPVYNYVTNKKLLCILPTENKNVSPPLLWHPSPCKPFWCLHKCSPPAGVVRLVGVLSSECTCRCLAVCGGQPSEDLAAWMNQRPTVGCNMVRILWTIITSFLSKGKCIHLPLRALHMEEMEYHQRSYVFAKYFWDVCHTKGFWSQCLSQPIICWTITV